MLATQQRSMDNNANTIHEPNAEFDFDKVTLTAPVAITGGNHYMKYLVNGKPLYLQTPVCKVKGGLHLDASGNKRPHCDLMFTNENESWIRWMEDLETHACRYMFERREKWFASELDMSDMENYFQSPLKIYKSGKFYLARTMVPVRLGKVTLKIYDDSEREIDPNTITEETDVMTILQVQGIKCSARSFQVELELKQMLVLSPTDVFQKCLLLGSRGKEDGAESSKSKNEAATTTTTNQSETIVEKSTNVRTPTPLSDTTDVQQNHVTLTNNVVEEQQQVLQQTDEPPSPQQGGVNMVEHDLLAVDVSLDESGETVGIKPRNEVFFEIYREARRKAKEARAIALAAYLEAKHIKNTYKIESDGEDDDEEDMSNGV